MHIWLGGPPSIPVQPFPCDVCTMLSLRCSSPLPLACPSSRLPFQGRVGSIHIHLHEVMISPTLHVAEYFARNCREVLRHSPIRPPWWPVAQLSPAFEKGMTQSLVLANGPLWKSLRPAWQPVFFTGRYDQAAPCKPFHSQQSIGQRGAEKKSRELNIASSVMIVTAVFEVPRYRF